MRNLIYLGCPAAERAQTDKILAGGGFSVVWADDLEGAAAELKRREAPVLLDLAGGAPVVQAAHDLRAGHPHVMLFAVADHERPELATEAVLAGVADVLSRPLVARRLMGAIRRELGYASRAASRDGAAAAVDALYSQSPAMREVLAGIARAAKVRAGVLVRGEAGTGRQVVARAIHVARSDNGTAAAFVVVDCGAFGAEQLERELFGADVRPSGVNQAPSGLERVSGVSRLHEAAGGTLYLKNVCDAPARVQARLARVLRDREGLLTETGAPVPLDVRPMAGVDHTADTAVDEGRLRADLFARLSVITIDLPPLRGRREDIPALANYFVREICAGRGEAPKTLTRPALALIAALPWRGNAAELRTLLENLTATVGNGRGIRLEDVLAYVRLDGGAVTFGGGGTLRQARARFEREYVASVLEQHHGRISEAAKALGIQRTNLYRKMRSLRVARERRR